MNISKHAIALFLQLSKTTLSTSRKEKLELIQNILTEVLKDNNNYYLLIEDVYLNQETPLKIGVNKLDDLELITAFDKLYYLSKNSNGDVTIQREYQVRITLFLQALEKFFMHIYFLLSIECDFSCSNFNSEFSHLALQDMKLYW